MSDLDMKEQQFVEGTNEEGGCWFFVSLMGRAGKMLRELLIGWTSIFR